MAHPPLEATSVETLDNLAELDLADSLIEGEVLRQSSCMEEEHY